MPPRNLFQKNSIYSYCAVAALAAFVYANTLFATGFIWDDQYIIVQNVLLRRWSSLPLLLASGYWEGAVGYGASVQEYRPVLMLTYFLTRQCFGLAPWIYHLTNLAIHAVNCALILRLLRPWCGQRASFLAALLLIAYLIWFIARKIPGMKHGPKDLKF